MKMKIEGVFCTRESSSDPVSLTTSRSCVEFSVSRCCACCRGVDRTTGFTFKVVVDEDRRGCAKVRLSPALAPMSPRASQSPPRPARRIGRDKDLPVISTSTWYCTECTTTVPTHVCIYLYKRPRYLPD
jgi:hypothetical protein